MGSFGTVYFGEDWGDAVLDGAEHVKTPVGSNCWYCATAIEDGHAGFIDVLTTRSRLGVKISIEPIHKECRLRSVAGSIHDLQGTCEHRGYCHELLEQDGLSVRDDALLVWDWFQEHGGL